MASVTRRSSWRSAALALVLAAGVLALNTECYHKVGGIEHPSSPGGGPCGIVSQDTGFLSCCAVGDQCVDGGLCHFTHPENPGWNESGYYVGGCTDSTLADSHCNLGCGNLASLDITFNANSNEWLCCGTDATGNVTCNDPTTQTVVGGNPASIATTYVVPSTPVTTSVTGTTSTTGTISNPGSSSTNTGSGASGTGTSSTGVSSTAASSTATQSSTGTGVPASQKSTGGTSNAGAIAGGVVGGVAFVAIVVGGYFWYRRRNNSTAQLSPGGAAPRYELANQGFYAPLGKDAKHGRAELGSRPAPRMEMDGLSPTEAPGPRRVMELP